MADRSAAAGGDLNAAIAAQQPPLIKIYSIVTHSMVRPFTDYVYLCNPMPTPVDASKFYIQKDVLGNPNGPRVDIPAGTIIPPRGGKAYVNLGSADYFVETGDNVKLVWNGTGSLAFGGSNIIVDRVEFNRTGGTGTLYWEPGNTLQPDEKAPDVPPPPPALGWQINRSATCGDTNSIRQDFFQDVETGVPNNPPKAPWPMMIDVYNSAVDDNNTFTRHITKLSSFNLGWTHTDPDLDAQSQADVAIGTSPNRGASIWTNIVAGPAQSTAFSGTLNHCNNYYYSVRTKDQTQWGPYAEWMFHTNCLPTGLSNVDPPNAASGLPPGTQTITWSAATDADAGDVISYHWQASEFFSFSPILAEGTTATLTAQFTTAPSKTYYWHVNATDGWESVAYTAPWQFQTAAGDKAPFANTLTVDTFSTAPDIMHILNAAPTLGWTFNNNGTTQTQSAFHVEVKDGPTTMWALNNSLGTLNHATYNSDASGTSLSQGVDYTFHVKVKGTTGLWSDWSASKTFRLNTPPPVPTTPVVPTSGTTVASSSSQVVTWTEAADAEGDSLTFEYCVSTTNPPPVPCTGQISGPGPVSTNASNAFTTTDGHTYYWNARAYDNYAYSAWSTVWSFSTPAANTPPTIALTQPSDLTQGQQYDIVWTMSDAETPQAQLVVTLTYIVNDGTPVALAGPLTGALTYRWTVPNSIDSSNVKIHALVTDGGGLTNTSTTGPFKVSAPTTNPNPPTDYTTIIIAVVIIIVIVVLLLFFLMKRKKPKEEEGEAPAEEAAPVQEEAPAEEELTAEEAPPPPKVAPAPVAPVAVAAAAKPAAKGPAKTKECPNCGTIVSATDKECFMCGAKL